MVVGANFIILESSKIQLATLSPHVGEFPCNQGESPCCSQIYTAVSGRIRIASGPRPISLINAVVPRNSRQLGGTFSTAQPCVYSHIWSRSFSYELRAAHRACFATTVGASSSIFRKHTSSGAFSDCRMAYAPPRITAPPATSVGRKPPRIVDWSANVPHLLESHQVSVPSLLNA